MLGLDVGPPTLLPGLETGWSKCTLGFIDRQWVGAVNGGRHSMENMSRLSIPDVEKKLQLKALWVPFALSVMQVFAVLAAVFP